MASCHNRREKLQMTQQKMRHRLRRNRKTAPVLPAPEQNPGKYCPGPEACGRISPNPRYSTTSLRHLYKYYFYTHFALSEEERGMAKAKELPSGS